MVSGIAIAARDVLSDAAQESIGVEPDYVVRIPRCFGCDRLPYDCTCRWSCVPCREEHEGCGSCVCGAEGPTL